MRRLYVYLNNEQDKRQQRIIYKFLLSVFAKEGWEVVMQNPRPSAELDDAAGQEAG
jgi:hypothetical protein